MAVDETFCQRRNLDIPTVHNLYSASFFGGTVVGRQNEVLPTFFARPKRKKREGRGRVTPPFKVTPEFSQQGIIVSPENQSAVLGD